jgi:hypothetical protein
MTARTLKIEETGDFFRRKIRPKIRLTMQWLERAGFKPGHRVRVELTGDLECHLRVESHEVACTPSALGRPPLCGLSAVQAVAPGSDRPWRRVFAANQGVNTLITR